MEAIGPNPGPSASGNDIYTGHKSGVMASASMPRTCSLERSRPSAEVEFNALKGDFYHGSYARASHDRAMHAHYHSSLPTDEPSTASRSDLSFTDLSNLPEWQRDLVDLEAAFALIHQVQGNTCEPAVTKYCQEVAQRLRRLRNGEARIGWSQYNTGRRDSFSHGHRHYTTVEYFFEIFSLQLEAEFSKQSMKTLVPSMAPQYIIYNLRNHFENIVDMGNLDDRRTPIMRENIDMLALAGRECSIFSKRDVTPVAVLWTIDICCRAIAFGTPIQHCDWLVNGTSEGFEIPSLEILGSALVMSVLSATIMAVLSEMWTLWDPFGKGMNTFSWSLGIATEIDHMLNEFYEYDTKVLVRKHAYMDPSAQLNGMMNGGLCDCSSDRPQTV
ncbi:hypothetical protein K4F52_004764 [Lecanicillium sp. MT-2017a]|nr:hypothetical protein K4F52_004764 [Lecanicillium sp. MT-2017a]